MNPQGRWARAALPAALAYARASCSTGIDQDGSLPLIAAGHSAGGQIALELALSRFEPDPETGLRAQPVDGMLAVSGVFDLVPLISTSLNHNLRFDEDSARAASPVHRALKACPALFVVGAAETPAFIAQSRAMHEAWQRAGNQSELLMVERADHFSVLRRLCADAGPLPEAIEWLLQKADQRMWQADGQPSRSHPCASGVQPSRLHSNQ